MSPRLQHLLAAKYRGVLSASVIDEWEQKRYDCTLYANYYMVADALNAFSTKANSVEVYF